MLGRAHNYYLFVTLIHTRRGFFALLAIALSPAEAERMRLSAFIALFYGVKTDIS